MKTRALALSVLVLGLAAAGPISAAGAATRPVVTSVSPLKAKVGGALTVRGSGFIRGPRRNTVIFMSDYGPTVFVKASSATSTRLTVPLPPALEKGMRGYPSNPRANRFRLRVVSREQARSFTAASKSPVISPAATTPPPPSDVDGDGILDADDPDNDNDFVEDSIERSVKTDPRKKDTDGDGLEDGWEYHSARDLNVKAVPYPGDRPFPNALDPDDGNVDYDGDFLRSREEHALWKATGRSFDASRLSNGVEDSALGYSDGTQTSRREQAPARPAFKRDETPGLYDAQWEVPSYPDFLDRDGSSAWSDDERDADRDGLSNITEGHMEMSQSTWNAWLAQCDSAVTPWENKEGAYYGSFSQRPFAEPDMLDADADGDGLLDAEDDQDNDDVPNYSELDFACEDGLMGPDPDGPEGPEEPALDPNGTANVHPYNPCAPHGGKWTGIPGFSMGRTCPSTKPLGG